MTSRTKLYSLIASVILVMMTFVSGSFAASQNLLVNGNASQGLKGWTTTDSYWKAVPIAPYTITQYDGNFFYPYEFKGKDGASTHIYQDVDIRNYTGKKLTLSAYVRTWDTVNTDETVLLLEFFDANGNLLDKGSTSSAKDPKWHMISVVRTAPASAVRARVTLRAVYHYGSAVDSFAASTAAFVSSRSLIVSMTIRSAPASAPASHITRKDS